MDTGLGKTLPKIDFSNPKKPKVQNLKRSPASSQVGALPNMILSKKTVDDTQSRNMGN